MNFFKFFVWVGVLVQFSNGQEILANYSIPEKNIDYPGNDIFMKSVSSASECAAECNKPAPKNCVGFVYYNETFVGTIYQQFATIPQGNCYLKSAMQNNYQFPSFAKIYSYKSTTRSSSASHHQTASATACLLITANFLLSVSFVLSQNHL
jgi:hypothetical protein